MQYFAFMLLLFFLQASLASAQNTTGEAAGTAILQSIQNFYAAAQIIAVVLAVVMIVWGGIHIAVSGASPGKLEEGKSMITSAIWGLVLLFGANLLLRTINPELINLSLPGLHENPIKPHCEEGQDPVADKCIPACPPNKLPKKTPPECFVDQVFCPGPDPESEDPESDPLNCEPSVVFFGTGSGSSLEMEKISEIRAQLQDDLAIVTDTVNGPCKSETSLADRLACFEIERNILRSNAEKQINEVLGGIATVSESIPYVPDCGRLSNCRSTWKDGSITGLVPGARYVRYPFYPEERGPAHGRCILVHYEKLSDTGALEWEEVKRHGLKMCPLDF